MIKLLQYTFLVAMSFASLPAFSMDGENEEAGQRTLSQKISNFQKANSDLDADIGIQQCLGIINGHASYLWLTLGQKGRLLGELASVTNVAVEDKVRRFNLRLKEIEDTREQAALSQKISNFQETNADLNDEAGIQQCLGIINGHASYLWLTLGQKGRLLDELTAVTNPTAEDKVRRFNLRLKEIEDTREQAALSQKIFNFQEAHPDLNDEAGIQQCLGIINGHASYLWLTLSQKGQLLDELTSVTNPTAEDKVKRFNTLLEQLTVERF